MLTFGVALVPRQHRALAWTLICLLLSTFLEAHRTYPYPELASESLCWAILYAVTCLPCRQWDYRGHGARLSKEKRAVLADTEDDIEGLVVSSKDGSSMGEKTAEVELLLAGAIAISSAFRQLAVVNWTFVSG